MYTTLQETMLKAVKEVKRPLDKSGLPVLNHALLQWDGEKLTITTTDLKDVKTAIIPCKLEGEPFATCVPMVKQYRSVKFVNRNGTVVYNNPKTAYPLYDFLKVAGHTLKLDYSARVCEMTIRDGSSKTTLKCIDPEDFPGYVAPVESTAPIAINDETAAIIRKYLWIETWEADPKKRMYKSTIQNGKANRRAELAALEAINVTSEFQSIKINA